MTILRTELFGRPLVGVYLEVSNDYVLYPPNMSKSDLKKVKEVFTGSLYPFSINNSRLIGVYSVNNKYGIIVPHILRDDEEARLEQNLANEGNSIQIGVLKSIDNAYGNLIICNDNGAIISSLLKDHQKQIEDILNVETVVLDFAGSYLPGSVGLTNNKGCLVHPLSTDGEIDYISSILKVETDVSTINRGIPYLSSGGVVNDHDGIFGKESTGPEMMRLTNILQL
ncbi:MAG: translation initiation factor IF-6 [Candidatus Lokiarchaeota archaeon]|nr:translation initiation factor IF-6 [Candidatus Lokiarchaeota archaeon]MBD3199936.1 translation initiation factor IF-6 [Candidatus Lokiarchaeota archaeon]